MTDIDIPSSYHSARESFLKAAAASGAEVEHLPISARGPQGEELFIDIARLGSRTARYILLHSTGLHGVEGFAGSAMQSQILSRPPSPVDDRALILIHGMNPFGMAYYRRTNENNVDLNRNFLAVHERYKGAPDGYQLLDSLINPKRPALIDLFQLRMLYVLARQGINKLKPALAGGQYEFPKGLFYGGAKLEEGPTLILNWLKERIGNARHVISVDVHMGLGTFGQESLLLTAEAASRTFITLRNWLGDRMATLDPDEGVAYRLKGGFQEALERVLPCSTCVSITQEFGTYPVLKVLGALREENLMFHHGPGKNVNHRSKRRLYRAFCPEDDQWRSETLQRGVELVGYLMERAFRDGYTQIISPRPPKIPTSKVSQRFRSVRLR